MTEQDYKYDQTKDVLIPFSWYSKTLNFLQEVEQKHSTVIEIDKRSHFNNETGEKISEKGLKEIEPKKLAERYTLMLDIEKTAKTAQVQRDPLGKASVHLMGSIRSIFKHNIDKGNCIKIEEKVES